MTLEAYTKYVDYILENYDDQIFLDHVLAAKWFLVTEDSQSKN